MPAKPKISVILPFYNAETTLDRALESIFRQEEEDFECLMIDNASTDGSPEIAQTFARADSRFRLLSEERRGVTFASNLGSSEALGEYLARMDADDVSLPERLRLQAAFLDENPDYGSVASRVLHVGDPETTEGFRRFVEWSNAICSYRDIYLRRFIEAPIVNPSAMWRRGVMERMGMYRDGDFPEDYELWLRWLDAGVKIEKLPEVLLEWHDSEDRLTRSDELYSDAAFYRIKTRYLARWLEQQNPFHPAVWVWGASRISRRRASGLLDHGIVIEGYIDTRKNRQLERQLCYYEDLPEAGSMFILSYIRQWDNREKIQAFLEDRGYVEGSNYLLIS